MINRTRIKAYLTDLMPTHRAVLIGVLFFTAAFNFVVGWLSQRPQESWVSFFCAGCPAGTFSRIAYLSTPLSTPARFF